MDTMSLVVVFVLLGLLWFTVDAAGVWQDTKNLLRERHKRKRQTQSPSQDQPTTADQVRQIAPDDGRDKDTAPTWEDVAEEELDHLQDHTFGVPDGTAMVVDLQDDAPYDDTLEEMAMEMAPADTHEYWVQRVFFGTDRAAAENGPKGPTFGSDPAQSLQVGTIDITIPKAAHRLGHMERPQSYTLWKVTLWSEDEDPAKHFTIHGTALRDRVAFVALAADAAEAAQNYDDTAFLYVHGFNTGFEKAMFRAAQLAHDLGFDGPAFAYSWPSAGTLDKYFADIESARNAAAHLDDFLDLVLQTPGINKLHIVAHSMGNEALAELFTRAGTRLSARSDVVIDQLILAAPDVDAARFVGIAHHFTAKARGVTLYACASDLALLASESLRGKPRAGDVPDTGPVVVSGIDTIDVTAVGTELFSLNHNTYARDRGLLDDVGSLFLTAARPPTKRMPTLRQVAGQTGVWWVMPG